MALRGFREELGLDMEEIFSEIPHGIVGPLSANRGFVMLSALWIVLHHPSVWFHKQQSLSESGELLSSSITLLHFSSWHGLAVWCWPDSFSLAYSLFVHYKRVPLKKLVLLLALCHHWFLLLTFFLHPSCTRSNLTLPQMLLLAPSSSSIWRKERLCLTLHHLMENQQKNQQKNQQHAVLCSFWPLLKHLSVWILHLMLSRAQKWDSSFTSPCPPGWCCFSGCVPAAAQSALN